jgi:hypothetical protein
MTMKDDLKAYRARWAEVEAVVQAERRTTSLELHWQQLNAAYQLGKGLGLQQSDQGELEVHQKWARLKEKAANQKTKA